MIRSIPDVFIAGAVQHKKKVSREEAAEIAYHNAAYILDEENLKLTVSVDKDVVYFIAAKGKDFLSMIEDGSTLIYNPLSLALPGKLVGAKETVHRGDGIYIYPSSTSLYHCVVTLNKKLYSYTARVEDIMENYPGLPVIDCNTVEESLLARWITPRSWSAIKSFQIVKNAVAVGLGMSIVSFCMYLASNFMFTDNKSNGRQNEQIVGLFHNVIHSVQESNKNDVLMHLESLQKLSAVAEKNRGMIEEYKVEGKRITWQMRLPAWVVSSEFTHLDSNITTEFNDATREVIVRKE